MRKVLLVLFFGACLSFRVVAQTQPTVETIKEGEEEEKEEPVVKEKPVFFEEPRPAWKDKLHYGGNIWLGFFGSFYLDASPMAGYEVTNRGTIVGLGASIIAQSGEFMGGPKIFVRQPIWKPVFAHAEYELINAPEYYFYNFVDRSTPGVNPNYKRKWGGSPLIGLGVYTNFREQQGSFISVMYNLGYPNYGFVSPQRLGGSDSPLVLRFGFFF